VYPEISLKDARLRRDEARKLFSARVGPLQQRKKERLLQTQQAGETFEKVGREWYGKQAEVWAPDHS
jgi:hypothetical protein